MTPPPVRTARQIHRRARLAAAAIAVLSIASADCHPRNSARGVVDRFIDAHYVAIDLKAAEPYCTGLALDQLHHEMALVAGQTIDASTRKPAVYYRLKAERDAPDHAEFLFRATIDVPDDGSFEKNWMIAARKEGDTWKVSNFSEYD